MMREDYKEDVIIFLMISCGMLAGVTIGLVILSILRYLFYIEGNG